MKPGRILLDTNVWLDYFFNRGDSGSRVRKLLDVIDAHGSLIVTTSGIMKDVFYLAGATLKNEARLAQVEPDSAAAREVSWECIRIIQQRSQVIEGDTSICLHAMTLRGYHDDFEDDLLIAAAQQNDVTLLISSDKELLAHAPVPCLTPDDATVLLESSLPDKPLGRGTGVLLGSFPVESLTDDELHELGWQEKETLGD